jgi:hypothetical protein
MVRFFITLILCVGCSFLYGQENDSTSNDVLLVTFIAEPPVFKGDLTFFIQENLKYPETAKKDSIEGCVAISYWIDTTGLTIDHKVIRS